MFGELRDDFLKGIIPRSMYIIIDIYIKIVKRYLILSIKVTQRLILF